MADSDSDSEWGFPASASPVRQRHGLPKNEDELRVMRVLAFEDARERRAQAERDARAAAAREAAPKPAPKPATPIRKKKKRAKWPSPVTESDPLGVRLDKAIARAKAVVALDRLIDRGRKEHDREEREWRKEKRELERAYYGYA